MIGNEILLKIENAKESSTTLWSERVCLVGVESLLNNIATLTFRIAGEIPKNIWDSKKDNLTQNNY